jgi:ArsR family transcriptional regulator, arsenate/arsenite/antimonite-responsive transcriptional repressor
MRNSIEAFKAIGEPTRFRALRLLVLAEDGLCACEIMDALEKPQYAISKCLGALVDAELLDERRDGRKMMYSLRHGAMNDSLFEAVTNVPLTDELSADSERLKERLAGRNAAMCAEA